jgi:2-polyprenyl-3-methyl-5-hydroxy-6-metoxy-1,4-benzoquinol methylase
MLERRKQNRSVVSEFGTFPMPARVPFLIEYLQNKRLRHLIQMIDFSPNWELIGLDIGCGAGYLVQHLASRLNGIMIGIDVNRDYLIHAKKTARLRALSNIEYINADINHLPFKNDCIDLAVCSSVLEHINDLDSMINEIKFSISNKGSLIAGYPIETGLFMALLKLFAPYGMIIRDPTILGEEKFKINPETHKQSFTVIRSLLQKHFLMVQRKKLFFTKLPDLLSWYECVKMNKV